MPPNERALRVQGSSGTVDACAQEWLRDEKNDIKTPRTPLKAGAFKKPFPLHHHPHRKFERRPSRIGVMPQDRRAEGGPGRRDAKSGQASRTIQSTRIVRHWTEGNTR